MSTQKDGNELQVFSPNHDQDHCVENTGRQNCFQRLLTPRVKKETREIFRLAWPTVLANVFTHTLSTQSILFCGHLGKAELAAGALAISFFNVFGLSIALGLCSALETLCAQAYGAKNFKMVGVVLQRGICILTTVMVLVCAFWMTTEHFLLVIGIDITVARMVDGFIIVLIPALPPIFGIQLAMKYLQTQSIVRPIVVVGFITNVCAVGLNWLCVKTLRQGFVGVAITLTIAQYINLFLLIFYIVNRRIYKTTWKGWSIECLYDWKEFLGLALPGMLMLCLEWWSFEVGAFLMGRFGQSTLAAHGVLFQLMALAFMVPLGISVAATVRVGNNLGSNNYSQAKLVTKLSILMTSFFSIVLVTATICARKYISMAFSDDEEVIAILIKTIPLMGFLAFTDAVQGVCSGVVRGCGRQKIGVIINFISFDIIAIPLGLILAFILDLRLAGMWLGLNGGSCVQATSYVVLLSCTNWKRQAELAIERTSEKKKNRVALQSSDTQSLTNDCKADTDTVEELNTANHLPVPLGFFKCTSLHDLDRHKPSEPHTTEDPTTSSLIETPTTEHRPNVKKLVVLRLIPLACAFLVLCCTLSIRMLVPLPLADAASVTVGNNTLSSNRTISLH